MNKKAKLYFLFIAIIVLGFSLVLGFLLDESMPITLEKGYTLYIFTKGFVSLALIIYFLYAAFFKKDSANAVIQMVFTVILQFLPLLVRVLLSREEPLFLLSIIIIFIVIIIYLSYVLALDLLSDKTAKSRLKLVGKTRNVVDEDNYYDENGKFVGVSKK